MKKAIWSLLAAFVLCLSLLPTAALAAGTTGYCEDGTHTEAYGNSNCTTCGAPLRATASWKQNWELDGNGGGYYTEAKNAFADAQKHSDSDFYNVYLLTDTTLDESVTVEHKNMYLYLNGYTLTLAPGGDVQSILRILPGGLMIREGSPSGGKIVVAPTESKADWVAGIELAGGKATFEGGEFSIADPYEGSAECSVVRMTGSEGNVFNMNYVSILSGENSYAVVADGSGSEVAFSVESENTYGRIKITRNYPGSVQLRKGTFAGLELEPGGKYQSLDQLLMSYSDYRDNNGEIVDGSGKQELKNVKVVHVHEYDEEGKCKAGDYAYADAKIVNSPNAEANRFYEDFDEALAAALLAKNAGCTLELWWENPTANGKNSNMGYIINGGKFTLDLRDRGMDNSFGSDVPEYVLKHTGGELTLTASNVGFELGHLRAYGPVKALGVYGGHVRIDGGQYIWGWYTDPTTSNNNGCIVELRSGVLEINGGRFSCEFRDETPADETGTPKIYLRGGNGPARLSVTGDAVFNTPIEIASDYMENGGKVALSGGTFSKIISKDASLTVAGMLAPNYLCRNAAGSRISYVDLSVTELENFSVVKCAVHEDEDSNGFCDYCNANLEADSAAKVKTEAGVTTYYADLKTAFEQVGDDGVITLLNDATLTEGITVEKSITLDLNGKTITGQVNDALLTVAASVTIRNDGNAGGLANTVENEYTVQVSTGGTLTVTGGTFGDPNMGGAALRGDTGSDITLSGGTFERSVFIYGKAKITNGQFNGGVVIDKGSAFISGGKFTATVTLNNVSKVLTGGTFTDGISGDKPLHELLVDGYAFKRSGEGGAWLTETELDAKSAEDVTVMAAPIQSVSIEAAPGTTVEYGTTVKLTANCNVAEGITGINLTWREITGNTETELTGTNGVHATLENLTVGEHKYRVTATADGYTKCAEITVTINKIDLSKANLTFTQVDDPYLASAGVSIKGNLGDGSGIFVFCPWGGNPENATTLTYCFKVLHGSTELMKDTDYKIISGNMGKNAGTYTITIQGEGNYTGTATTTWEIKPYTLTNANIWAADITKTYDGTNSFDSETIYGGFWLSVKENINDRQKLNPTMGADNGAITINLTNKDYEISNITFGSSTAGEQTAIFTVTLTSGNFVFEDGSDQLNVTLKSGDGSTRVAIDKANAPENIPHGVLTVYNRSAQTYEVELDKLLPGLTAPCTYGETGYGEIKVALKDGYYKPTEATETAAVNQVEIKDGKLLLPIESVNSSTTGKIGTVTVTVTTTNYQNITLTIDVSAANKPSSGGGGGSSTTTKTETTKNPDGSVTKTETRSDGTVIETTTNPDGSVSKTESKTTTKSNGTTVETVTETNTGADGSKSTSKTETTTNKDGSKTETKSETKTEADGTKSETKSETKTDANGVTNGKETTKTTAPNGSTGTTTTTTENGNTKTEAEAKISNKAVEDAKKSGEAVKVPAEVKAGEDSNSAPTVKVELPKNAGETKIEIPVSDVNSGTVAVIVHPDGTEELVKDSKPTEDGVELTVDGSATIKIIDNSKDFLDTRDHWSRDEVNFVVARELFNGVGGNNFGVNQPMTRGMVNTVLARLAGIDTTPKNGQKWYEVGTEWAKANGISDGTNPEASVTREQLATLLYRFSGTPEVKGNLLFSDAHEVSAYAQDALLWATQNGILNGVGNNRVAPNADAQRAQVAAMMARYLKNVG